MNKYYLEHREQKLKYQTEYTLKNQTKVNKIKKDWYQKNKEKILKEKKEYYTENNSKILIQKKEDRQKNPEKFLLRRSRYRAKKLNLPHDIELSDIKIPDFCPYLGIPIIVGDRQKNNNSPSLDRIIPELGYVKGNIEVISDRANTVKSNGTADEHDIIAKRMYVLTKK